MTWKTLLIAIAVALVVGVGAGIYGTYRYFKAKPIVEVHWLKPTSPTTYQPTKPGETVDWKARAQAPLTIMGTQHGFQYDVHCFDAYKYAIRTMQVDVTCPVRHHELSLLGIGGVAYDNLTKKIEPGYGAAGLYGYSFGPAALQLGPGFIKWPSRLEIIALGGGKISF